MLIRSSLLLLLLCCLSTCHARITSSPSSCVPSSCGKIHKISFPFRLNGDPENCGNRKYELECQNNTLILNLNSVKYQVQSIDYDLFTIRLLDPDVEINNRCYFPLSSTHNIDMDSDYQYSQSSDLNIPLAFIKCSNPVNSSPYVDINFCTSNRNNSNSLVSSGNYSYIVAGDSLTLSGLEASCSVEKVIQVARLNNTNYTSLSSIHEAIAAGLEFYWKYPLCLGCYGVCSIQGNALKCQRYTICYEDTPLSARTFRCRLEYYAPYIVFFGVIPVGGFLGLRLICGLACLIALIVYQWKRRHLWSECEKVQDFMKDQNPFKPIHYSYSEIKKMTNNFKEKLGVGSCGYVFRGKLRSGPSVAVKVFDERTTANSEEFLRFVAAIGRVDHVNVMQLIGFCCEGPKKRALVYDLMPNGSIKKYISPDESGDSHSFISCENLYGISLGMARGIEYLLQNCDIQAPHLGFKPHNVLLDENFVPKISDFGLAKLCPRLNYAAPEFHYKNIGDSHQAQHNKADVYSFGTLLVEMIGRMKNVGCSASPESQNKLNNNASSSSPPWKRIHDQLVELEGTEMAELRDATAEERKMMKKMIRVGYLCIQMNPDDRPSIVEVVNMLEQEADAD